jgi:hypothetical protein
VLTNSTGDLVFAINATGTPDTWTSCTGAAGSNPSGCGGTNGQDLKTEYQLPGGMGTTCISGTDCLSGTAGWDTLFILIPPGFKVPGASTGDTSLITSTITNSYDRYSVAVLGPNDRYAPGWTLVTVSADATVDANTAGTTYYNHQFLNFTSAGEWYYVRINGVTAPSIAGRYFFKMLLGSDIPQNQYGVGPTLGNAIVKGAEGENPTVWVPPQNWPVMLVKGETDPAIVTGTLRYAGYNATLYQQPIAEAGKVWAHMTMRLDPYTGQQRPDLATIDGQAYVNATANGHYELEGLAPGVYDIYAEAAGYPQTLCVSGITVLKGQSLHFDCYLQPGPVIHGNVFTKHQFGDEPWPGDNVTEGQYMKIELYSNPTLSNIVDSSAGSPVTWSPLPCTAGGQEDYDGRLAAGLCGDPRDGSEIAFPWHEYAPNTFNTAYAEAGTPFRGTTNGYIRDVAESVFEGHAPGFAPTTQPGGTTVARTADPEGVGPPQSWFVSGGTTTPFHFEFGVKGEYGAPRDLSGEVPQVYATWVNGLTPGRYYVRAWTFRYVQTALDGATFQEYYFDVTPNEWAGDVTLPIDLRLSSWVNKTVYFHDTPNTIETNPIHSGAGYVWGQLTGADGHVYSSNVTGLGLLENETSTCGGTTGVNCGGLPYMEPTTCTGTTCTPPMDFGHMPGSPLTNPNTLGTGLAPYYYFGTNGYNALGPNAVIGNPCFAYDQKSYGFDAANTNFFQTGEFGAPSQLCPYGSPGHPGQEVSALDKAGLNANSIATGKATIQFWGINDTWGGENYGIPSGTYTPNVYVNGYVSATPAEQVSVTLSGNPTSVSDHMFLGPGFNVSVYSIDWERPRVSRSWIWAGCQDSEGSSASGEYCLGSEIDLGWYPVTNGTAGSLYDYFGPEPAYQPPSVSFYNNFGGLYQGPGGIDCITGYLTAETCSQMDGGGRNVLLGYSNAHDAYYGQSAKYAYVGGYTSGIIGFSTARVLLKDGMFTCSTVCTPHVFNQGQYNIAAYTYGYIQDKDFSAYAMDGQIADMKVNLIIGVNLTLDILFKKESIITGTPYNMSARVRAFNDQGQLVAEWMSSEGTYVNRNGHAIAANGALPSNSQPMGDSVYPLYPFQNEGGSPYTGVSSDLPGYNYLPGGVTLLHVQMAGLPQQIPEGSNIVGVYFGDPIFTYGCDFELDCYPAAYAQYPFPYTGIAGAPDYTGGWTAEVDFVPWYANNTGTMEFASGGLQTGNSVNGLAPYATFGQYYPPVTGLLMGESYHIIPGTTATSGVSLTEDAALSSTFVGHTMGPNHLGPYSQEGVWQIAETHNSGEASAIFEVDLNGFVSGSVLAFTWSNEFRTLSWGTISVTGASGGATWNFYTYDGIYQAYMPTGNYKFTISQPGYAPQTWSVSVSPGQVGSGQNVYLEQSNIPVPEFGGIAVVAFSVLAASVYLLKRRHN